VIVVVVDIAVRVKLYGLTHVCNRSTVGKTECDETAGKVCYGEPSQFCCILVGLPDMLFRFRSRQPLFPPVCTSVMLISAMEMGVRRVNWRNSRPTFSTNHVLAWIR
jgi:hypothetical protein